MTSTARLMLVSVALGAVGCAGSPPLSDRMFDHFGRAGQIQTALIVGDLEGARRPASWLAEHERFEGLPAGHEGWVSAIRGAAREVARSGSIEEATEAAARLGAACAGCHRAVDDGPQFRLAGSPPGGRTRVSHMARHLWAMDRMWEGLIAGSTEIWAAGADAIADAEPERAFPGGQPIAALAVRVHAQARGAREASESERPEAYAGLLETCASCHTRLQVGR